MLLHRQRPEDSVLGQDAEQSYAIGEIDCAQPQERPGHRAVHHAGSSQENEHQENAVVCREDSERTAVVEPGVVAGRVLGVEKDSGNQESGQHEKQIHPGPAISGGRNESSLEEWQTVRSIMIAEAVEEQHQKTRNASQGIELGHFGAEDWG